MGVYADLKRRFNFERDDECELIFVLSIDWTASDWSSDTPSKESLAATILQDTSNGVYDEVQYVDMMYVVLWGRGVTHELEKLAAKVETV